MHLENEQADNSPVWWIVLSLWVTVNLLRGFSSCYRWHVRQYPNLCVCFVIKKTIL